MVKRRSQYGQIQIFFLVFIDIAMRMYTAIYTYHSGFFPPSGQMSLHGVRVGCIKGAGQRSDLCFPSLCSGSKWEFCVNYCFPLTLRKSVGSRFRNHSFSEMWVGLGQKLYQSRWRSSITRLHLHPKRFAPASPLLLSSELSGSQAKCSLLSTADVEMPESTVRWTSDSGIGDTVRICDHQYNSVFEYYVAQG